jgi:preprotein translocase SecE subunit
MADTDKDALKAAKEAEKAALKAKKDRIKQSKPKKDGNIFSRLGKSVKKFWKDFTGTCKKIVWPGAKQVLKSSAVVLASIIVVGLVIFGFDRGVGALFSLGVDGAEKLGQQVFTTEATASEGDTDATTTEPAEEEQTSTEAASEEESTEETTTAADEG